MINPTDVLRQHAHALRIAAPLEWERFVAVFDAYSAEVTVAVIAADQSEILTAQGRAKAFRHLAETFRNCHVPPSTKPSQP